MMIRTISTACCRLTARASSRGAVPNTSTATEGRPRLGCLTQSTKAAMPAWATRPIQERFSADMERNQDSRCSIEAMAAVPREPMARSSRATVSARTLPGGAAPFPPVTRSAAVMLSACHGFGVLNPLAAMAAGPRRPGSRAQPCEDRLAAAAAAARRPQAHGSLPVRRRCRVAQVRALLFDVFGTVVDWRSGVIRDVTVLAAEYGADIDAASFADRWRAAYRPAMNQVRTGELAWTNLDGLHRRSLDQLLAGTALDGLDEAGRAWLTTCWHRLDPWPDAVAGPPRLTEA